MDGLYIHIYFISAHTDLFHDEVISRSRCKCEDNRIHGYLAPAVKIKKEAWSNERNHDGLGGITRDYTSKSGLTGSLTS